MSKTTATTCDARYFAGRASSSSDGRRILRLMGEHAVMALGAVAAVGVLVVAVTFAAAWILNTFVATNPLVHARAPTGPGSLAFVQNAPTFDSAPAVTFADRWPRTTAAMWASAMPLMPQHPVAIAGNVPLPPLRPVPVPPRQPKPEIAYAHGLTQVARLTTAPAAVPATTPLPRTHPAQHEIALPTVHQIGIQVAAQIAAAVPPAAPPAEKLVPPVQEAHNKSPALPTADSRTAVYDIAAHTVYLPNGQRLEAHSGLYDKMDDPRFVHIKMRGPTPPNVYELTLREQLFHGVRAIRLNPVDDNKMFGRDGILAHTYMLGPNGQSNGCVSFRDYEKFLQAYLRGEVDRMVVVASLGRRPPLLASRPVDDGWRSASNF